MGTTRILDRDLARMLYAIAEDGSDDEINDSNADTWAGLLRDLSDVASQLPEVDPDGQADPEEVALLENAAGVIVTRSNPTGTVSARLFEDDDDLEAEWTALKADLEPSAVELDGNEQDTTEGPSGAPLPEP